MIFEMKGEGVEGAETVEFEARGEIEKMTINPIKRDKRALMVMRKN